MFIFFCVWSFLLFGLFGCYFFCCLGRGVFFFCCLGGVPGPAQTARKKTPPPKQQKKNTPPPLPSVFCFLLFGRGVVFFLLFGRVRCFFFCCLGGGRVFFCCLGGGRVLFFAVWAGDGSSLTYPSAWLVFKRPNNKKDRTAKKKHGFHVRGKDTSHKT